MKSILSRMRRTAPAAPAAVTAAPATTTEASPPKLEVLDYQIVNGAANCPLSRLPLELHFLIIDHLDADAYLAALQVCRVWRYIWLSDEIWPGLAECWLPGFNEKLHLTAEARAVESGALYNQDGTRNGNSSDRLIPSKNGGHQEGSHQWRQHNDASRHSSHQGSDAEQFRQLLQATRKRNTGRFATALHYGIKLVHDQFFRISTAVPIEEGGVHKLVNYEPDSDGYGSSSSSHHKTDDKNKDDGGGRHQRGQSRRATTHFRFMMYNNGRIAWWPQAYVMPYSAVVDDFRTGQRRMYDFPEHGREQSGYIASMSSHLLLMGKGCILHAWHLELDRLSTAVFPADVERVFVEGDRLLAVSKNSDVYYWQYGQDWTAIDMQQLAACYPQERVRASGLVELPPTSPPHRVGLRLCESGTLLDFILHPVIMGHFFVVTFSTEHRLCVHEIGSGGQKIAAYEPSDVEMTVFKDLEDHHGYLRWEKIDSFGGYCLMLVNGDVALWRQHRNGSDTINVDAGRDDSRSGQAESITPDGCRPYEACAQPDAAYTVVAVCFNIYTKEFDFMVYHPPWHFQSSWHIWNGILYTPDGKTGRDVLIASNRCGGRDNQDNDRSHSMDTSQEEGPDQTSLGAQQLYSPACYTTIDPAARFSVGSGGGSGDDDHDDNDGRTNSSSNNHHHHRHQKKRSSGVDSCRRESEKPSLASRRLFTLTPADQEALLADPALPGTRSVRAHVNYALDLYQKHTLPFSPPSAITVEALARSPQGHQTPRYQAGKQRVLGDDRFLMFVDDQSYTVWSFADEIAPPPLSLSMEFSGSGSGIGGGGGRRRGGGHARTGSGGSISSLMGSVGGGRKRLSWRWKAKT